MKTLNKLTLSKLISIFCIQKHEKFIQEWRQLKGKSEAESMLDFQIQKLAENKGISQDYLDSQQDLDNIAEAMFRITDQSSEDSSFKEELEENIKNFDKNCTQENLEKDLEAKDQLITKIIENTLSGQDFDAFELEAQSLKKQGLTENQIKKQRDFIIKHIFKERNENWLKKNSLCSSRRRK